MSDMKEIINNKSNNINKEKIYEPCKMNNKEDITDKEKVIEIAIAFLNYPPKRINSILDGFLVSHPFIDTVMVMGFDKKIFNIYDEPEKFIEWKKDFARLIKNDFSINSIFVRILKPYRLIFFKYCSEYLSKKDFAEYLSFCYTTVENIMSDKNVTVSEIIKFFKCADKEYLMNKSEYEKYISLPEMVTIYRGVSDVKYKMGISWTLVKEKAEWFANRFTADGFVYKIDIPNKHILAYFEDGGEEEIILDICKINKKQISEI